jgi:hypothetical protein
MHRSYAHSSGSVASLPTRMTPFLLCRAELRALPMLATVLQMMVPRGVGVLQFACWLMKDGMKQLNEMMCTAASGCGQHPGVRQWHTAGLSFGCW